MTELDILVAKVTETINNERESILRDREQWNKKIDNLKGLADDKQSEELSAEYVRILRRFNNLKRLIDAVDKIEKSESDKERDKAFEDFRISLANIKEREVKNNETY